jgi:hypothetical protein
MRMLVRAVVMLSMGNAAALAVHEDPSTSDPPTTTAAGGTPPSSVTVPSAPTTTAPVTTAARPTTPRRQAGATPSSAPTTSTTTAAVSAAAEMWPLRNEGYDYELTLTPTCAKPGQPFTATMRLKTTWGAGGVFMPFYADGSFEQGKGASPEQNGDGTVTYTWVARPVSGEGRLVTQAYDPETKQNGTKVVAFFVAKVGGSC